MLKVALAAAIALSGAAAGPSGALAGPVADKAPGPCLAVFESNKAGIERLAEARDIPGIKRIFAKAGCPEPSVSIADQPASRAALAKIKCKATLFPPAIICTFGIATKAPNAS